MNRKLLATAIAAATVMASSAFAGDVTVYGKMNVSYNQIEKDEAGTIAQDNWELETFASRLGFKGSEEITDTLKAIYKLEYQVIPDGEGSVFKARNSYVGLQGGFGSIVAGNHDTPTKMSQGKVDVFNDYSLGDIGLSIPGERRENDIIMYRTPDMGAFSAILAIMPGEDSGAENDDKDSGPGDQISASLVYKQDALYAAIGLDDNVNGMDIIRVTGTYKLGDVTLGAMIQEAEDSDINAGSGIADNVKGAIGSALDDAVGFVAEDQSSYLISAAWKIDKITLKAQYIDSTYEDSSQSLDNTAITIGADYKLSKRTKIYTHYTQLSVDKNENIGIVGDYEYTGLGLVGIEHKF